LPIASAQKRGRDNCPVQNRHANKLGAACPRILGRKGNPLAWWWKRFTGDSC